MDIVGSAWPSSTDENRGVGPTYWPRPWAWIKRPARYDAGLLRVIAPQYPTDKTKPERQRRIIDAVGPILNDSLAEDDMNTDLRAAHWSDAAALRRWSVTAGSVVSEDGLFGVSTDAAVRQFQPTKGFNADGVAEPATFAALGGLH